MSNVTRFLFKKGIIQTILYLSKVGEAGYYETYKQGFVVSRQTFANLLKTLEKKGLVNREVTQSRPPRTNYSLTQKGDKLAKILKELNNLLKEK